MKKLKLFFIFLVSVLFMDAQTYTVKLGVLKYSGGGDWYADPTAVPNLAEFCNKELGTTINPDVPYVDVGSPDIFNYPFLHLTGHGNVLFTAAEAQNLRNYLLAGGFLHIDDNYGMDPYIRRELKKVFPEYELKELPFSHPIYHQKFKFPNGLPKIHEHDNKPPQGFGIVHEGRLVVFYTFETDLSDGWEDAEVHKDTPEMRLQALQMGANIISFVFTQ
jgi:hypothetical protein